MVAVNNGCRLLAVNNVDASQPQTLHHDCVEIVQVAHLDNKASELLVRQLVVGEDRNTIAILDPRGQTVVDRLGDDIDTPALLDEPLREVDGNLGA